MNLPPSIILDYLSDFCICYFKDTKNSPDSPPHYYVNIPVNDISVSSLYFTVKERRRAAPPPPQTSPARGPVPLTPFYHAFLRGYIFPVYCYVLLRLRLNAGQNIMSLDIRRQLIVL
ncbi:hypothetical protein MBAV_003405 [Candidatus Magnetobacterium bavaricum]|uniref:Uncharacterized protein n=1 Tax=Candidatus Magnetobacterium bavaricum TaxID=29290 RepID=A0A0F3GR37_9BACT|nr:hypothetical protein MBAV_003405 [Candidatus Magnetobacterium bavaricum]